VCFHHDDEAVVTARANRARMARIPHSSHGALCTLVGVPRAWWRTLTRASRLILTLCLLVFGAHHAAPNAPIWHGEPWTNHTGLHAAHETRPLAFTSNHDHLSSHCELCFSSAFNLIVASHEPPRPDLHAPLGSRETLEARVRLDLGLPDAHAPPGV
jgi:hypothetical protein